MSIDFEKLKKGQEIKMVDHHGDEFNMEFVCTHNGKAILYCTDLCWPYYDFDPEVPDGCELFVCEVQS